MVEEQKQEDLGNVPVGGQRGPEEAADPGTEPSPSEAPVIDGEQTDAPALSDEEAAAVEAARATEELENMSEPKKKLLALTTDGSLSIEEIRGQISAIAQTME